MGGAPGHVGEVAEGLRPGELCGLTGTTWTSTEGSCTCDGPGCTNRMAWSWASPRRPRAFERSTCRAVAVAALRAHHIRQAAERRAAGPDWHNLNLIFATSVGTLIDRWSLARSFALLTDRAGLGAWHPTELRHTAVSLLSDAGVRE